MSISVFGTVVLGIAGGFWIQWIDNRIIIGCAYLLRILVDFHLLLLGQFSLDYIFSFSRFSTNIFLWRLKNKTIYYSSNKFLNRLCMRLFRSWKKDLSSELWLDPNIDQERSFLEISRDLWSLSLTHSIKSSPKIFFFF